MRECMRFGQCAHVDLPDRAHSPDDGSAILNALLPPQIRIMRARFVTKRFPRTLFRASENISLSHLDRRGLAAIRNRTSLARA